MFPVEHFPSLPIQSIITFPLHQVFSWKTAQTLLSYQSFSFFELLFPFPWKIINGLIWGIPSTNIVSWTVHWRLSRPDAPVVHHISLLPLLAYVVLSSKMNGNGVWSILVISFNWSVPHHRTRVICEWKLDIASDRVVGLCWAVCMFLRSLTPYLWQNLSNHWWEYFLSPPG